MNYVVKSSLMILKSVLIIDVEKVKEDVQKVNVVVNTDGVVYLHNIVL